MRAAARRLGAARTGAARAAAARPLSTLVGEHLAINYPFERAQLGDVIELPYEHTVTDAWRSQWYSVFYEQNRVNTSALFAKKLGLADSLLPFSMLLFHTGSMAHLNDDLEVLDLGYVNATMERAVHAGDTLRKVYVIKGLRPTNDGKRTVVTVGCELFNALTGDRVFSVDKRMIYPELINPANHVREADQPAPAPKSRLLEQVATHASHLDDKEQAHSLAELSPGQLLLHGAARPLQSAALMALSSHARLTHPLVFNTLRYPKERLAVPGALVLAQSFAAASRSLFEVIHESVDSARHLAPVHPDDVIGAVSYVHGVKQVDEHVERATIVTMGVKNVDVVHELAGVPLPSSLFQTKAFKPREYEALCREHAPQLAGKLVSHSVRQIYRQSASKHSVFLL